MTLLSYCNTVCEVLIVDGDAPHGAAPHGLHRMGCTAWGCTARGGRTNSQKKDLKCYLSGGRTNSHGVSFI